MWKDRTVFWLCSSHKEDFHFGSFSRIPDQTYIACDWATAVKDKCYDLEVAVSHSP